MSSLYGIKYFGVLKICKDCNCTQLEFYRLVLNRINFPIDGDAEGLRKTPRTVIVNKNEINLIKHKLLLLEKVEFVGNLDVEFVIDFLCENDQKVEVTANRAFVRYDGNYFKMNKAFEDSVYDLTSDRQDSK